MVEWVTALSKTRNMINQVFSLSTGDLGELNVEDLEEILLRSDVPVRLTVEIIDKLDSAPRKVSRKDLLRDLLLMEFGDATSFSWPTDKKPFALLLLGVNGSGKTTTATNQAMKPMLCGSDIFRAEGSFHLKLWSEKAGSKFVGGEVGADAAGVAYNAIDGAMVKGCDPVIVDSAGRMHAKPPLMDELPEMCRSSSPVLAKAKMISFPLTRKGLLMHCSEKKLKILC